MRRPPRAKQDSKESNNVNKRKTPYLAYGCLALSMSLVGSYVGLSRTLVTLMPVFLLAWLRFGIGGLAMLHWLKKPATELPMTKATRRLLFLQSLLGNFLFSIFMLYGMRLTSALAAGVIMAAIPAVIALMSRMFLRETMAPRVMLSVLCAVAGISLSAWPVDVMATVDHSQQTSWLGNLLLFAAVVCEAAYAVIGKRLADQLSAKRITSLINLWGFVLMAPMGLVLALQFDFSTLPAKHWLLLVFYSLAASVWSVWLWMTGLKHVPAAQSGVFTVFLPISAAAVGVVFLGEHLGALQIIAFCIALLGVLLATVPTRPAKAALHSEACTAHNTTAGPRSGDRPPSTEEKTENLSKKNNRSPIES